MRFRSKVFFLLIEVQLFQQHLLRGCSPPLSCFCMFVKNQLDVAKCWRRCGATMLVGMQNGIATLEGSLVVSYKTKHTLMIQPSNHFPWYLPKWVESLCLNRNLHKNVYNSFINNCQNLEATKMIFSRWIDK